MKQYRAQLGFTIIELVVYIGLLSILIAVMSQVFVATLGVKLESESDTGVSQDGNYIITRLAYDIRRASRIISPNVGESASMLSLGIIEGGIEQVYEYTLTGDTLSLSDGVTTESIHGDTTTISDFSVSRFGNSGTITDARDTIQFILTVTSTYTVPLGAQQMTFQSTEGLR